MNRKETLDAISSLSPAVSRITEEAELTGVPFDALLERILYYGWEVYREELVGRMAEGVDEAPE